LLRLIGPQKEAIGMKPLAEALKMGTQNNMDLILINPEQAPPVARLIQWSK
jgi:translation initiation factor IF-3